MNNPVSCSQPLVSVGIPTYNRVKLLRRAIESVVNQKYKNLEIIVSDNASADETESLCNLFCAKDPRIKYLKQQQNIGGEPNFRVVLDSANGEFFMWLGDDDWIDESYIAICVNELTDDASLSLVSGVTKYYRNGENVRDGEQFNLLSKYWWVRVIKYYKEVKDNGMFYGLMRTNQVKLFRMPRTMASDWHFLSNIVLLGKMKVLPGIPIHRELGGATDSYIYQAISCGLSKLHGIFPMTSAASSAFMNILVYENAYKTKSVISRFFVASSVFMVVFILKNDVTPLAKLVKKILLKFVPTSILTKIFPKATW